MVIGVWRQVIEPRWQNVGLACSCETDKTNDTRQIYCNSQGQLPLEIIVYIHLDGFRICNDKGLGPGEIRVQFYVFSYSLQGILDIRF